MSNLIKRTIDLNQVGKPLNEALYTAFANKVRDMMLDLYAMGFDVPMNITGTSSQVGSFMKALKGEKRYMDSYIKHGLDDPRTMNSKYTLSSAVKNFELETGLRWPFKN
tara:strand:+ start:546 stop:872 length:327 start_codon:yes stop_codon:yes gene_type:complete